jgi:Zincin-like metallopeptidase
MSNTARTGKAQYLPDRYRPDHSEPQGWRNSLGKVLEDSPLPRRPLSSQLPHRQTLSRHECPAALVQPLLIAILAHLQTGTGFKRLRAQRRKGTPIVFYKQLQSRKDDQTATDEKKERIPFVFCYYTVFNVEQCDSLTLPQIDQPTTSTEIETDETCEAIVTGWGKRPAVHLTGEHEYRAYYRPSSDSVHMPTRSRFVDTPHYYSTLFHELVHSTGHESRLHRSFGAGFGDELYSKEELIAEMGAAFLSAIAGIAIFVEADTKIISGHGTDHLESITTIWE